MTADRILGGVLGLCGFAVLFYHGGPALAFGVLVCIWGNNLERAATSAAVRASERTLARAVEEAADRRGRDQS